MTLSRRQFLKTMAALASSAALLPKSWQKTFAAEQRFLIPPTVQHVTETSAVLYFRLGEPTSAGRVVISSGNQIVQEIPFESSEAPLSPIFVTGLAPSTTYHYQVLVNDATIPYLDSSEMWTDLQFSTPPYAFPLRVAAIGDSGFGQQTTYRMGEQMAAFEPHLFLHLGDVVYHMNEYDNDHFVNWQMKYFLPFKPLLRRIPHYPTFGNHEQDGPAQLDGVPSYYWMFPPFNEDHYEGARVWYGFDFNGIQFLSLNTQLFYSYPELKAAQEVWLDAKLARTDVLYTVIFCHVAPYTSSSPHQWDGIYAAEQWSPKFTAAKVPLVLSGHAHVYERLNVDGVNYLVAGAGSDVLYGMGERLEYSQKFYSLASYPILELYPDRIHLTVRTVEGEMLDELDLPMPA